MGRPPHLGRPVPGATHNDASFAIHTVHLLFMSRVLDSEGAVNLMNANLPISRREIRSRSPRTNYSFCRKRQLSRNSLSLQWHPNLLSNRQFSPVRCWLSRYLYFFSTPGAEQSWETKYIFPWRISKPASLFIRSSSCFPSPANPINSF